MVAINTNGQKLSDEDKRKKEVAYAVEQLQLNTSQAAKYEKIIKKYTKLVSEIQSIHPDSARLRINKRNELMAKRSAEMKAILTPEQYAQYRKWMGEDRNRLTPEQVKHRVDSAKMKKD
jgi:Spy/CpxP family protein refolding chaperone